MSMPELLEGLSWAVEPVGADIITVSIHNLAKPHFPSLGGEAVSLNVYDNEAEIVKKVEEAAKKIYERVQRELYVRDVVGKNFAKSAVMRTKLR